MSVVSFTGGGKFVFRIVKHHHDNPSDQWVNNYEMVALDAGTEADLLAAGLKVVAFEKEMHSTRIQFDRLTISTWEADSVPYDPEAFISVALTDVGQFGETTGLEPLNECLSVARVCAFGRFGHIFYRGVLDAAEVFAPGGRAALVDETEMQGRINDAITASSLDDLLGPAADTLVMALIPKSGTPTRVVQGLSASGVSFLPLDHAWFNRTSPAPLSRQK